MLTVICIQIIAIVLLFTSDYSNTVQDNILSYNITSNSWNNIGKLQGCIFCPKTL